MSKIKEKTVDLNTGGKGFTPEHTKKWLDSVEDKQNERIDVIGQNGNDGEHYGHAVKFIETEYPETAVEFKKLQKEQYELFCKKQMDYGPSNIAMGTSLSTDEEKRLSKIGLIVRINDKIQRLKNLLMSGRENAVENEPMEDAYLDVSNYGIMATIVGRDKWGK